MHLPFVFLVCLLSRGISAGVRTYEETAEYVNADQVPSEKETRAVVVESDRGVLENVRTSLGREGETTAPAGKTLLATFDSTGLLDATSYNDTFELVQALKALTPPADRDPKPAPTLHVLAELAQKYLSNGSLMLVTKSKPSDEDFMGALMEALRRKNLKLSVLWVGDQPAGDCDGLKALAVRSGGEFKLSSAEAGREQESLEEGYSQKSYVENAENFSERFRFPEEKPGEEMPLVTRAANQRAWQKAFVPLIVEVASGTSLETRPGAPTQIQFNVKNNINVAVPVFFNAKYNGIIQTVQPPQKLLQPGETITVIVNLQPIGTSQTSAVGTVTLVAVAANKVTARSALVFLTSQTFTDKTSPKIYHKFEGDCTNYRDPQTCENGHWSLEATIHDEDSGLLKILSEPYGLLFQSEFVAGTKTPVTVFYGATCCQPIVQIWAEDLKGNYVKKSYDVFNQTLLAGEIASIVLGILLLLFIIIIIIAAVVLVKRRNRRNMIIPRARSGSR